LVLRVEINLLLHIGTISLGNFHPITHIYIKYGP